jgi:transmembrane sensor
MSDESSRLAEAAAWRVRLAEGDHESSLEHSAWIAADARNAAAWKQVQEPWTLFSEQAIAPEIIERRWLALAHAHEAGRGRWVRSKRFAIAHRLGIAAGVVALAVGGLLFWTRQPDVYSTRVGERRVVTLADGSQITLDSKSEVRVSYSAHARELTLASGQARFDVAHDVERPFSVTADGHEVIATGTSFNVDLFGPSLLITLIEGHVVVSSASPDQPVNGPPVTTAGENAADGSVARVSLDEGEQVVFSRTAPPSIVRVNTAQATAWENGEVMFENDSLSNVVARVNRYARHGLVTVDRQSSELRISGVFHTGDIDGFVNTMVSYLPVRAEKGTDGITRLTRR